MISRRKPAVPSNFPTLRRSLSTEILAPRLTFPRGRSHTSFFGFRGEVGLGRRRLVTGNTEPKNPSLLQLRVSLHPGSIIIYISFLFPTSYKFVKSRDTNKRSMTGGGRRTYPRHFASEGRGWHVNRRLWSLNVSFPLPRKRSIRGTVVLRKSKRQRKELPSPTVVSLIPKILGTSWTLLNCRNPSTGLNRIKRV